MYLLVDSRRANHHDVQRLAVFRSLHAGAALSLCLRVDPERNHERDHQRCREAILEGLALHGALRQRIGAAPSNKNTAHKRRRKRNDTTDDGITIAHANAHTNNPPPTDPCEQCFPTCTLVRHYEARQH